MASGLVTIFGYGPTGQATAQQLIARGTPVRIVQRSRPKALPPGADFQTCDVLNAEDVVRAMQGAEQAVVTIGFAYRGDVWEVGWPQAMRNLIAAAEAQNVRVVHVDNMYMYGAQDAPLGEDMPLLGKGRKPRARVEATRLWQAAARDGRVTWAALRAPDFYGPGVLNSHLGETGLKAIAAGKTAQLLMSPDLPHAFAYVPDIGRAVVSLLEADDSAFNQVWHVPCAPTRTPRELLKLGADAAGVKLKVSALPHGLLSMLGWFAPAMREFAEMQFTWDRPYHVDAQKFGQRFWSDATPFDVGVPATVASFASAAAAPSHTSRGRTPAARALQGVPPRPAGG